MSGSRLVVYLASGYSQNVQGGGNLAADGFEHSAANISWGTSATGRLAKVTVDGVEIETFMVPAGVGTGGGIVPDRHYGNWVGDCNTNSYTTGRYWACVQNPTMQTVTAYWKKNGVIQFSRSLAPGQSACFEYTGLMRTDTLDFGYTTETLPGGWQQNEEGQWEYVENSGNDVASPGSGGQNYYNGTNTSYVYDPRVPGGQNSWSNSVNGGPINYNGTATGAARDDTLKAGFNALASQNNELLKGQAAIVQAIGNLDVAVDVTVTNIFNGPTNGNAALEQVGEANTNASAALAAGELALGSATVDAANALIDAVGDAPVAGGGAPDLSIEFMGQTLDLDPAVRFPGFQTVIFNILTGVVLVLFAMEVGRLFLKLTQTYACAQSGGVPNLEGEIFGIGGNAVGVIVAIGIPIVLIAIWVAVFTVFFSAVTSHVSALSSINDPLGGMSSAALYLIMSFIPVNLVFSLLWTRIVLMFTMGKLILLSSSATRFLFGK